MRISAKEDKKELVLNCDAETAMEPESVPPTNFCNYPGNKRVWRNNRRTGHFAFSATLMILTILFIFVVLIFSFNPEKLFKVTFVLGSQVIESKSGVKINIETANNKDERPLFPRPVHRPKNAACSDISVNDRFDCDPEKQSTEEGCLSRGCCWKPAVSNPTQSNGVPYCYYPSDYVGYEAIYSRFTDRGLYSVLRRRNRSGVPIDTPIVIMNCTFLDKNVLRIKFTDPIDERYEVPYPTINEPPHSDDHDYSISLGSKVTITRKSTGKAIVSINLATMVYSDSFLQASIGLPSKYVYGVGESKDRLMRDMNWKRFVLFNRDRSPIENFNTYGSHPFYMSLEDDGNSNGVFLFNSNAMEVVLQPMPAITFRTIGGILDFYIMTGPTPADVVKQYTSLIGRPFMPPYWSLGFHLCRYGYKSVNDTRAVWERTRNAGIPFDTQWNDIDYMDKHNDFTLNKKSYSDLPEFIQEIHDVGMHYMIIIDPGISNAETKGTYAPFDDGLTMDVFVKNSSGQLFVGKVWNSVSTVFPDFTHPNATAYWTKQFKDFHDVVPFDGAWIDMNEPSNFFDGQQDGCPQSQYDYPYYVPGGFEKIFTKTVCMSAKQHASLHYNVHNLYGLTETIVTNSALRSVRQKRPFIISRSTFPGQGHFGGHWDGDISSDWDNLAWTIPSILTMNMLGITMIGADICGFNGNTTLELCARWSELGAFYPFSRNHNSEGQIDQDPVALGPEVVKSAKDALTIRYFALPYLYTLFYRSHVFGETVVRPLFFEFPLDKKTYSIDTQFMWGSAAMIVPVLTQNATQVTGYFPTSVWYDVQGQNKPLYSKGQEVTLDAPLTKINTFIRGGAIVPLQVPGNTTTDSRKNVFYLIVALSEQKKACGELYWDDGDSLDTYEAGKYNLITFEAGSNTVTTKIEKSGFTDEMNLGLVQVYGVENVKEVFLNGQKIEFYYEAETQLMGVVMPEKQRSFLTPFTLKWN